MRSFFYLRSAHCELNLITLSLSDKDLQNQLREERAHSFNQLFWWAIVFGAFYLGFILLYMLTSVKSPTTLYLVLIQYSFILLWAVLRLCRHRAVRQNLPRMSTLLFAVSLLMLNLMYRGYVDLGGAVITNG